MAEYDETPERQSIPWMGGKYAGQLKDGVPHGHGRIVLEDGARYAGEWKEGEPHGQGTVYHASGGIYRGELHDGRQHGYGIYTKPDREIIKGLWENGKFVKPLISKKDTAAEKLSFPRLIRFNKTMGFVHFIQGTLMMLFAFLWYPNLDGLGTQTFTIPVVGNYLEFIQGEGLVLTTTDTLFELPFLPLTASFLLISALFHFIIAFPYKEKYVEGLKLGINRMRWYEYALSSSLMIVLIASLFGVRDIAVFALIALSNAAMNFFGLDMELLNSGFRKTDKRTNWLPFIFGSIIGLAPWLAIAFYIGVNPNLEQVPSFVWAILATYFIAFNTFPVNMYLQYKGIGKFKNYLYGERGYIILSLVAKTILTWLVLFGAFQP